VAPIDDFQERSCPSGNTPISDSQGSQDGRDGGAEMTDVESAGNREAWTKPDPHEASPADEMKARVQELVDYRDAGVLSDDELEEQKAKLRWGVGLS
jgi:hypothetical protein